MVSPSYFPAIAAVELGFYKKEGLDAAIELVFPVTKTFEELREGRLDFVGGAAHAPLYAFRDWTGCKLLCALSQNMYWFLVVRKDIGAKRGDLRALKGLRIGAAPGPADGLKRMLVESGIDPEREVNLLPVPTTAEKRLIPAAELALIPEVVGRDAFYYDPTISRESVDSLNAFARATGLLSGAPAYERVVATQFQSLWRRAS